MSKENVLQVFPEDESNITKSRSPDPPKATRQATQSTNVGAQSSHPLNLIHKEARKDLRKRITAICQNLKSEKGENVADLPAIKDLCELFQQLASLSSIQLDGDAIHRATQDLNTLLKIVEKYRYSPNNLDVCFTLLKSLLRLSHADDLPQKRIHATLLKELSYLYLQATEYPTTIRHAEKLLDLATELGDPNLKADADFILGFSYIFRGSFEEAFRHLQVYKRHCVEYGDELGQCFAAWGLSKYFQRRNDTTNALANAKEFMERAKQTSDQRLEMEALCNLSTVHLDLFNVQQSLEFADKTLKLAEKTCDKKMIIESKFKIATAKLVVLGKNQESYDTFLECLSLLESEHTDRLLECIALGNIGYAALVLSQTPGIRNISDFKREALEFPKRSLSVAKAIDSPRQVAFAHLNIGLALMESYRKHDDAIEHFQECLEIGENIGNARLIHNGYCSLGRAHQAKGDRPTAQRYYANALETPDLPSTHWGETENLRFSPEYWLALLYIEDRQWQKASGCLKEVICRSKHQRQKVDDSLLKIPFNDTQKRPYQYLQHVYLQEKSENALVEALAVAEEGRARDFYDKFVEDEGVDAALENPGDLLAIAATQNTAVLFLSQLDVVNTLHGWFIAPNGKIAKVFQIAQDVWQPLHTSLCVTMHELHAQWSRSKLSIEFRGVEMGEKKDDALVTTHSEVLEEGRESSSSVVSEVRPLTQDKTMESALLTTKESTMPAGKLISKSPQDSTPQSQSCDMRGKTMSSGSSSRDLIKAMSDIVDQISDVIAKPIQGPLEKLTEETTTTTTTTTGKPSLLIIPQGDTFNIPYAALRLRHGKHLCHHVTVLEAFSFHSYFHSIKQSENSENGREGMRQALIVGNPRNGLSELPCAQQEAQIIADLVNVTPLTRSLATRSEVLRQLPYAPIIHFACHGSQDGRSLFLAPECNDTTGGAAKCSSLTVEDVSSLKIRADMVVLSACHTARGQISSEGVLGLARAFLIAGAKSVVTALWAIPDDATKAFMVKFYKNLAKMPVCDALSTTMCEMRKEKPFKDIVQWGPFKVLGANIMVSY